MSNPESQNTMSVSPDTPLYPTAAPPSGLDRDSTHTQPAAQLDDNQNEAFLKHANQPYISTAIVTQPQTPAPTYGAEDHRDHIWCAVCALILSIAVCFTCFWPIGLFAMKLASKLT